MRGRLPRALSVPAVVLVCSLTALPAAADVSIPTTPVPHPVDPGDPPVVGTQGPQPLGHAVGDAGSAVGDLQVLPGLVDTTTIMPGMGDQLPKQPLLEGGLGTSSAQVNSEAYLNYERSIAESSPLGFAFGGNSPRLPGALSQTALPDNPQAVHGGLQLPKNPLLNVGLLQGSANARYSPTLGPCTDGPISDSSTSVANLSAVNLNLPGSSGPLSDVLNPGKLAALPDQVRKAVSTDPAKGGIDPKQALSALTPKASQGNQLEQGDSGISLISAPNLISSRSQVKLVDMPGTKNKAVRSATTFQFADVTLFKGLPIQTQIKVASQPKLTVTSTGKKDTSKVEYTAPMLEVHLPFLPPIKVDARHPFQAPLSLPLPSLIPPNVKQEFTQKFGMNLDEMRNVPVLGEAAKFLDDKGGNGFSLDLGLLRLKVGDFKQNGQAQTKGKGGAPFSGYQLGASANMASLDILPLDLLKLKDGPKSLATATLGKQVARAYAPTNGVECGTTNPGGGAAKPSGGVPAKPKPQAKQLAYTNGAYESVPLFWTGTGLLLAGAVLMAALPRRRARR